MVHDHPQWGRYAGSSGNAHSGLAVTHDVFEREPRPVIGDDDGFVVGADVDERG